MRRSPRPKQSRAVRRTLFTQCRAVSGWRRTPHPNDHPLSLPRWKAIRARSRADNAIWAGVDPGLVKDHLMEAADVEHMKTHPVTWCHGSEGGGEAQETCSCGPVRLTRLYVPSSGPVGVTEHTKIGLLDTCRHA